MIIEGRNITRHPLEGHSEHVEVKRYRKTAVVLAGIATDFGTVHTPEGDATFSPGDLIVTDDPVTHAWPVRQEVFERTHEEV